MSESSCKEQIMETKPFYENDEHKKLVAEIQKSLDEIRLLFLRVRSKPGINQLTKEEIDEAVETLEEIKRQLPDIAKLPNLLDVIFGLIKKTYGVWQRVFSG